MGGGGGSSHSETVRKRDPDSAEISALQSLLYSQYTPMASQLGGEGERGEVRAAVRQGLWRAGRFNGVGEFAGGAD